MDVERTMEFILNAQAKAEVEMAAMREHQAKAEVEMAAMREHQTKAEAKAERQMAAIRTLIRAGMKMIAKNDQLIRELAKAQKVTETKLQSLLDSLRRGGNGNHRKN